jgi:D-beta-D-heptose 7-phosphate kinase/D-beta-D-heptose 1-phosphate adenosyltransferase
MVDEYLSVKVNRISPEFPMPIMWSSQAVPTKRPGGAANVAYQFKHFNVDTQLFCFWDYYAVEVFKGHGLLVDCAWGDACCLPIKRRFLDGSTQIVRHDIETELCGFTPTQIGENIEKFRSVITDKIHTAKPDVAIFSDYNKGFFEDQSIEGSGVYLLDLYDGVTTIVDPKKGPLGKWHGCTIFKPNAKEACELSGYSNWRDQSRFFQDKLGCKAVVITEGGERVTGIESDELFEYRPNRPIHVESVIGAGDCFAAMFALAVGYGFTVSESAEIAWNAGAVYVQRNMNSPIIPAEVSWDGIVRPEDLAKRDFKLVFANGCFDLLHEGHLQTLEFAKSKGKKLVVALNSDASVKRLKGEDRPIKPLNQRMAVMAALEMVDFVVSFSEDTPLEVIQKIRPDVLVKGGDWETGTIVGADIVPEVYRAPVCQGLSTTNFLS